jgi:hypothetical protein
VHPSGSRSETILQPLEACLFDLFVHLGLADVLALLDIVDV